MNSSTCNYRSNPSAGSSSRPATYSFSTPSPLPLSSPPFPLCVNTHASLMASGSTPPEWDEAVSTARSQHADPNMNPWVGYQHVTMAPQPASMPTRGPPFRSMDTMAGYINLQSHWRPGCQEGMGAVYTPQAPILGVCPPTGIALSLPIDPPANPWAYPGHTNYRLQATDPLTVIPPSNGGASSHSAEWANHFAAPTLASARDTNHIEAATSFPQHGVAGRELPRHVRPRAEERSPGKRAPKQKRQAVSVYDPQAEAILRALSRELGCCEAQGLECGPCFMRRVGELGIMRDDTECARHECLLMLMAIDPGNRRSRSIADSVRRRVRDLVKSHLRLVPPGSVRSALRVKDPRGWVRTRLVSDPYVVLFTRKEG